MNSSLLDVAKLDNLKFCYIQVSYNPNRPDNEI